VVLGTGNGFLAKFQVTMLGNLPAIRNYSRLDIHQAEMYLLLYKLSPAESYKYLRRLGRHKRNNNTTTKRGGRRQKKKKMITHTNFFGCASIAGRSRRRMMMIEHPNGWGDGSTWRGSP
jgi:hypothetical protein